MERRERKRLDKYTGVTLWVPGTQLEWVRVLADVMIRSKPKAVSRQLPSHESHVLYVWEIILWLVPPFTGLWTTSFKKQRLVRRQSFFWWLYSHDQKSCFRWIKVDHWGKSNEQIPPSGPVIIILYSFRGCLLHWKVLQDWWVGVTTHSSCSCCLPSRSLTSLKGRGRCTISHL